MRGDSPLWGFPWKKSPARNSADVYLCLSREKSELYRLGFQGSRWWSFGVNQVTTKIEVWLRFHGCAWLLGRSMFGEIEGTEHCKDISVSPPTPDQARGTRSGSVRVGDWPAVHTYVASTFSHQQPKKGRMGTCWLMEFLTVPGAGHGLVCGPQNVLL